MLSFKSPEEMRFLCCFGIWWHSIKAKHSFIDANDDIQVIWIRLFVSDCLLWIMMFLKKSSTNVDQMFHNNFWTLDSVSDDKILNKTEVWNECNTYSSKIMTLQFSLIIWTFLSFLYIRAASSTHKKLKQIKHLMFSTFLGLLILKLFPY